MVSVLVGLGGSWLILLCVCLLGASAYRMSVGVASSSVGCGVAGIAGLIVPVACVGSVADGCSCAWLCVSVGMPSS